MKPLRTVILFFSYSAVRQAREKRFCKNDPVRNHRLAAHFIRRTLTALRKSGLPVVHYHEEYQRGESFGQRLQNAYADLFDLGYEAVIAVGNDSPDLHKISWDGVAEDLRQGKPVLGPDHRGGAYLIALTRDQYENGYLDQIPWHSGEVFHVLATKGPFCILTSRPDLNNYRDLIRYLRNVSGKKGLWLKNLLLSPVQAAVINGNLPAWFMATPDGLRAPPIERK